MTYNIHHGADAHDRASLPRIAALLAETRADVVCLQEVDRNYGPRSGHADQVAELGDRLGMHTHFGATIDRRGGQYGNALLARCGIGERRVHQLPTPPKIEARCAVSGDITTELGPVRVITTHLTVGPAQTSVRREQLDVLAELVAASPIPTVLTGDFNTGSRRGELAVLERSMSNALRPRRFAAARLGLLWGRPHGATFPVRWPVSRIDRVYVSGLRVARTRVLPGDPSDHRALLVELTARD